MFIWIAKIEGKKLHRLITTNLSTNVIHFSIFKQNKKKRMKVCQYSFLVYAKTKYFCINSTGKLKVPEIRYI